MGRRNDEDTPGDAVQRVRLVRYLEAEAVKLPHHYSFLDIDGELVPWGWGSVAGESRPKGWQCPQPGCTTPPARKETRVLIYADGDQACIPCAEAWCRAQQQMEGSNHE